MAQISIHVGLHKTATTFLQTLVFPKLENTVYLSRPYTQLNHAFNKLQYADDSRFSECEILQEIEQFKNAGKILISDEMLSGVPNFNYINRSMIAHRLSIIFPDANIILFLRSQVDLILSLHNTWIKNLNGTRPIDSFISFPSRNFSYQEFKGCKLEAGKSFGSASDAYYFHHDRFTLNLTNFYYYELVNFYKSLFKRVHIFLFEDFRINPEKTISSLENLLDDKFVDLDISQLLESKNVSLGRAALEGRRFRNAIYELTENKFLLKFFEVSGWISSNLSSRPTEKSLLEEKIGAYYRDNNLRLLQSYPDIGLDRYPNKYQL